MDFRSCLRSISRSNRVEKDARYAHLSKRVAANVTEFLCRLKTLINYSVYTTAGHTDYFQNTNSEIQWIVLRNYAAQDV